MSSVPAFAPGTTVEELIPRFLALGNPTTGIARNPRRPVGKFVTAEQMAKLGTVLDARHRCMASRLIRLLMLTGCRVGEAATLIWDEVERDRLALRDSKTGPREVTLGIAAQRFL